MGLEKYRQKRDFSRTSEPSGKVQRKKGWSFVVQKHAASRLHYDFRLELDGLLKSWSIPKGPSADSSVKRLAVETEDHPVEYGSFEGIIPQGEYGGGTVLLWDRGTWTPVGDPQTGLRKGKLDFELHGERLSGLYTLVRMNAREGARERVNWLLWKRRDGLEHTDEASLTELHTTSVESGRTLEEIASAVGQAKKIWESGRVRSAEGKGTLQARIRAAKEEGERRRGEKRAKGARDPRRVPVAGIGISHGERVIDPGSKTTKLELVRFYEQVAPLCLVHAARRPLALVRCPEGVAGQCFFQKHSHRGMSSEIHVDLDVEGDEILSVVGVPGVVALAQWGVVELHGWGSRLDRLESPDWIVLDLDPSPEIPWSGLVEGARLIRERLSELGFVPFVKTTGGKGLHLVVPLVRRHDWDMVKSFSKALALDIAMREPTRFTHNMAKHARHGRIFVDHLRNVRGSTAVLPYSVRARDGLPVAMPIEWSELDAIEPRTLTVSSVPNWLAKRHRDPWLELRSSAKAISRNMLDALAP